MSRISGLGAARGSRGDYCKGRQRAEVVVLASGGSEAGSAAHEGHGINLRAIVQYFEMHVRSGGAAG
jgi:hypothetical protein